MGLEVLSAWAQTQRKNRSAASDAQLRRIGFVCYGWNECATHFMIQDLAATAALKVGMLILCKEASTLLKLGHALRAGFYGLGDAHYFTPPLRDRGPVFEGVGRILQHRRISAVCGRAQSLKDRRNCNQIADTCRSKEDFQPILSSSTSKYLHRAAR